MPEDSNLTPSPTPNSPTPDSPTPDTLSSLPDSSLISSQESPANNSEQVSAPVPEIIHKIEGVLAHLWMIRTFLKHADDIQDSDEMLEIPRLLYDSIRAVEPARLRKDWREYIHRLKGKIGKLKKGSIYFAKEFQNYSVHTNFEQASLSFSAAVKSLEDLLKEISIDLL